MIRSRMWIPITFPVHSALQCKAFQDNYWHFSHSCCPLFTKLGEMTDDDNLTFRKQSGGHPDPDQSRKSWSLLVEATKVQGVTPLGVGGGLFSQSALEFLLNCLIFILISWKTEYDVNVVIAPHCLKNMVTLTTSRGSTPNPNLEDTNYWWLTSSSETSSLPEYGFLALTKYSAST